MHTRAHAHRDSHSHSHSDYNVNVNSCFRNCLEGRNLAHHSTVNPLRPHRDATTTPGQDMPYHSTVISHPSLSPITYHLIAYGINTYKLLRMLHTVHCETHGERTYFAVARRKPIPHICRAYGLSPSTVTHVYMVIYALLYCKVLTT